MTERPRAARSPRLPPSIPPSLRTAQTLRTSAPPLRGPPLVSRDHPPPPTVRAGRLLPTCSRLGRPQRRSHPPVVAERCARPQLSAQPAPRAAPHRSAAPAATAFPLIAGRGRAWQHPPARPGAGGGARGVNEGPEPLTGNCWREPRDAEMVGPGAPPDGDGLRAPGLCAWGTEG